MAIPLVALLVASSMSAGGLEAMLITVEGTLRQTFTSIAVFLRELF